MKAKDLKSSILQMAVEGKLVPQDPMDEPASTLLERIREEKHKLIAEGKAKFPKGGESIIYTGSDGSPYEKRIDAKGRVISDKCIASEVPFEIPESWTWAHLGSLCDDILVPQRDKPRTFGGDIPWCRIEDIDGKTIGASKSGKTVDAETVRAMNLKVNPVGTVLCSNSATIGVPAIVSTPLVTNQRFIGFVCGAALDNWYLYYLFLANHGYLCGVGTGTTQSYIARSTFESMLVPLPPLAEQRRIVERVSELMPLVKEYGKLEEAREALDTALPNRLRKSVLQMVVQGKLVPQDPNDEPASALLERIREQRRKLITEKKIKAPKGGESVIYIGSDGRRYEKRIDAKGRESELTCIEDEIPFDIPESWEWARLGSIAVILGGATPDKGNPSYWRGSLCWASMKDIHGDVLEKTLDHITQEGLDSKASISVCHPGDLVVSTRLIPGKSIISRIDSAINQDLKIVRTNTLEVMYLHLWFQSMLERFKRMGSGTTVPGIKLDQLSSALIPVPPRAEQRRIAGQFELLASQMD